MKNKFKKVFAILMAVLMIALTFVSCSSATTNTTSKNEETTKRVANSKLTVVTTIFAPYDFVRQVAGDTDIDLTMLLKPGTESHTYEPTSQDIIKIQKCDLFIYVGGENDKWVDNILSSLDKSVKTIKLLDCVNPEEEEAKEGMQVTEEKGDEKEWDEHVWTSPKNAITISSKIAAEMEQIDTGNAETYKNNVQKYTEALTDLDNQFKEVVENAKRKTVVFADRFPARYFVEEYGLDYFAAFPGCSSESEASASTVAFLIKKVKAENIPVVFYIELSNEKMADTIVESTNAKKLLFHCCHNVSKEDFDNGATYLSLMTKNVANLKEALN